MPARPPISSGLRATKQREVIQGAIEARDGFRSAQELHVELVQEGARVGLTTVYRTLQALSESGEVDSLRTADGEVVYRRCTTETHHHHLVCRDCGRTVEIAGPEVERWADAVAHEHGFTEVTHTLEVFGLCRECAEAR